jgi:hypothetical protein
MANNSSNKQNPQKKQKRPNIRITKPSDVRRLLNRAINELRDGQISNDTLRATSYAAKICLQSFEVEAEIKELEKIKGKLNILETTHGHY